MKTTEIRELSAAELDTKLADLKEELFNLRFQMATGQCENPMKIRDVKKSRYSRDATALYIRPA